MQGTIKPVRHEPLISYNILRSHPGQRCTKDASGSEMQGNGTGGVRGKIGACAMVAMGLPRPYCFQCWYLLSWYDVDEDLKSARLPISIAPTKRQSNLFSQVSTTPMLRDCLSCLLTRLSSAYLLKRKDFCFSTSVAASALRSGISKVLFSGTEVWVTSGLEIGCCCLKVHVCIRYPHSYAEQWVFLCVHRLGRSLLKLSAKWPWALNRGLQLKILAVTRHWEM